MKLFNTGLEQANLVVLSNVLPSLWVQISKLYREIDDPSSASASASSLLGHRISAEPKWSTITFASSRGLAAEKLLQGGSDLESSIVEKESFDIFEFLRGKTEFAINRAVITLFRQHLDELSQLKIQIMDMIKADPQKPLIITGHCVGGSIASLFTLWLLDSGDFLNKKRPICVTFGSPLIGDHNLQKALYKYTPWCSNFLHVASNQDPVPRMFANPSLDYMPFGMFLLCSESGCSCFEEPETVLILLTKTPPRNQSCHGMVVDYGKVVEDLERKALFKKTVDTSWVTTPYQVGTVTQLSAISLVSSPQPEVNSETKNLIEDIEKWEMKFQIGKRTVKPDKKLNDSKMNMAKLEWYMKLSKDEGIGYYDSYKNMRFTRDVNIQECVKRLIIYWTDVFEEVEKKPQAKGETLRTRWLFSALNYMRLVEPLYIAEYYSHEGLSGYEEKGRLKHFIQVEKLVGEAKKKERDENKKKKFGLSVDQKKKSINVSLMGDSCFWAKVEEAIILCKAMKKQEASEGEKRDCETKLKKFEDKVLGLLENYDLSPEIFLEQSSFMLWWKDYKEAMGSDYTSPLNEIMVNRKYIRYSKGEL